jgi:hypothetical protein
MRQPPTADLGELEIRQALMRGAAGDHGVKSGLILLAAEGWLPKLHQADLITVDICLDGCCGDAVAWVNWTGVGAALHDGRLTGSPSELAVLRVAASLSHGLLVDLGELAAGLDRWSIGAVRGAIALATYDPDVRRMIIDDFAGAGAAQPQEPL